jgi:death-on-curing protein
MIITGLLPFDKLMHRLSQKDNLPWMDAEEIIGIHDLIVEKYGGLAGIRDEGLLHALGDSPRSRCYDTSYDGGHLNIYDFASNYMYDIAVGHPFNDGNKRTAVAVALEFIYQCGVFTEFDTVLLEQLVKQCANWVYKYKRDDVRKKFLGCRI